MAAADPGQPNLGTRRTTSEPRHGAWGCRRPVPCPPSRGPRAVCGLPSVSPLFRRGQAWQDSNVLVPRKWLLLRWYPDQELNLDQRFRKPPLYPFELSGQVSCFQLLAEHPSPAPETTRNSRRTRRRGSNRRESVQQSPSPCQSVGRSPDPRVPIQGPMRSAAGRRASMAEAGILAVVPASAVIVATS